jgi:hypothetical protein
VTIGSSVGLYTWQDAPGRILPKPDAIFLQKRCWADMSPSQKEHYLERFAELRRGLERRGIKMVEGDDGK